MNTFFQAINELNPNAESMTVTVLEGTAAGEKAIISDGQVVYLSEAQGFLSAHREELTLLQDVGIQDFAGAEVYVERIGHGKKMVVCGAGHVSMPIIKIGKMIGMQVTAIDDRPVFAHHAEEAGADVVLCDEFEAALDRIAGDNDTYFVIVTRGHQWDTHCLRKICGKPHAYIGMMGSRRRVRIVKEGLIAEGIPAEIIESVHSPIGLNIGSETPEEIAVSVLGEIISVKNQKKDFTYPKDIMTVIIGTEFEPAEHGRMMMATIVARKGSAPREVGTKMLIRPDGSTVNTIGGGCVEAEVITKAKELLLQETVSTQVIHVDLTADEASQEGEVCGGVLDVLLEGLVL